MKSWNYQIWLHIFTQFGCVLLPNLAVICYLIWRKRLSSSERLYQMRTVTVFYRHEISLRMPFLVGQAVVVLVDVVFRLALDNQPNT